MKHFRRALLPLLLLPAMLTGCGAAPGENVQYPPLSALAAAPPLSTLPADMNEEPETTAEPTGIEHAGYLGIASLLEETDPQEDSDVYYYRGTIFDINGEPLVYTEQEENASVSRVLSEDYVECFSNVLADNSGGLDAIFAPILRAENPEKVGVYGDIGRSVQVTYDAEVQRKIYNYMKQNNLVGACVVMRTDGSLMAEVSYPSYDANRYSVDSAYIASLPNSACNNKCEQTASPGSCFKIMSEVLADKHGIDKLDDEGEWKSIHNWDWGKNSSYPIEDRPRFEAFRKSSNVFFAKTFEQIGERDVLKDLEDIFLFSEDVQIVCDFGPLRNRIYMRETAGVSAEEDTLRQDDLRRSGFGQANVQTTPVFLAALVREAVFGEMVRPFTLKYQVDTNDYTNIIGSGSRPYDRLAVLPQEYRANLLEGMEAVASDMRLTVPAGYELFAKTGTAEIGNGDYLYVSGCLRSLEDSTAEEIDYTDYADYKESGGSYIVITQIQNGSAHGYSYASDTAPVYGHILRIVLGQEWAGGGT